MLRALGYFTLIKIVSESNLAVFLKVAFITALICTVYLGVHTTNRIRVRWPDIESNAYLTDKPSESIENLGVRSPQGTEGKESKSQE